MWSLRSLNRACPPAAGRRGEGAKRGGGKGEVVGCGIGSSVQLPVRGGLVSLGVGCRVVVVDGGLQGVSVVLVCNTGDGQRVASPTRSAQTCGAVIFCPAAAAVEFKAEHEKRTELLQLEWFDTLPDKTLCTGKREAPEGQSVVRSEIGRSDLWRKIPPEHLARQAKSTSR